MYNEFQVVLGDHIRIHKTKMPCCKKLSTFKFQKQKLAENWSMKNFVKFANFLKSSKQYIVLTSEYNLLIKILDKDSAAREDYFSTNVQAVCDINLQFTNLMPRLVIICS